MPKIRKLICLTPQAVAKLRELSHKALKSESLIIEELLLVPEHHQISNLLKQALELSETKFADDQLLTMLLSQYISKRRAEQPQQKQPPKAKVLSVEVLMELEQQVIKNQEMAKKAASTRGETIDEYEVYWTELNRLINDYYGK
jgi:hypothetical protein